MEQAQFKSSLDPEKECLILHLPLTLNDVTKISKKLDNINENENSEKNMNNIFLESTENSTQDVAPNKHVKEYSLDSELQITETFENKKKCMSESRRAGGLSADERGGEDREDDGGERRGLSARLV